MSRRNAVICSDREEDTIHSMDVENEMLLERLAGNVDLISRKKFELFQKNYILSVNQFNDFRQRFSRRFIWNFLPRRCVFRALYEIYGKIWFV